jgi:hypothetical protein
MKNLLIAILIIFSVTLTAQVRDLAERQHFKKSDWEVSTSLALGLSSVSFQSNPPNYYNYRNDEEFYSEIALTLGYFVTDGLSVEPELNYNFFPEDASLSIIINLSYTIHVPKKNVYPFFRIGYGKSGYHTFSNYYYYESVNHNSSDGLFSSLDTELFNAGAGLKFIQSSTFAMRMELNYKYLSSDEDYTMYDYYLQTTNSGNVKSKASALSIKFGASFLF